MRIFYPFLPKLIFVILSCAIFQSQPASASAKTTALARLMAYPYLEKPNNAKAIHFTAEPSLSGSRGEKIFLLLNVSSLPCGLPIIKWDGSLQPDISYTTFDILPFTTKNSSYFGVQPGVYFDPLLVRNDVKKCDKNENKNSAVWLLVEFKVSKKAKPGRYKGTLSFRNTSSISINLHLWNMTMSESFALPMYSEYTPWFGVLGHYGKWHADEAALTKKYVAAMLEHRILPLKSWIRQPDLSEVLPSEKLYDFAKNSSKSDGFAATVAQLLPSWAYLDFLPPGAKVLDKASYWKYLESSVRQLNWQGRAISYLWDEPKPSDFPAIRKSAAFARENFSSLKLLVTTFPTEQLADSVDIFAPLLAEYAKNKIPIKLTARQELWSYVSCMSHGCSPGDSSSGEPDFVIERPAAYIRSIAWIAHKINLQAFLYYSVNNSYQFYPKRDPWNDLWEFSGNGDGTLFYPGRAGVFGLSEQQPIPSLRLKLWTQASYDAEYIKWMQSSPKAPDWYLKSYGAMVQSSLVWEKNAYEYEKLRVQMGDWLDKQGVKDADKPSDKAR